MRCLAIRRGIKLIIPYIILSGILIKRNLETLLYFRGFALGVSPERLNHAWTAKTQLQ